MTGINIRHKLVWTLVLLCVIVNISDSLDHNGFEDEERLDSPKILRSRAEFIPYLERKGIEVNPHQCDQIWSPYHVAIPPKSCLPRNRNKFKGKYEPSAESVPETNSKPDHADLPLACIGKEAISAEVRSYQSTVDTIVQLATQGAFKGKTFEDVAEFVDRFGHRITGSESLESSIDYLENLLRQNGAANIQAEDVEVPDWRRGKEIATMLTPREKPLAILGLGQTVGTSILGITADAAVFSSYEDLMANLSSVEGKIAVLNYGGPAGEPLGMGNNGYSALANAGARAALYKSATTFSIYSPHARRANLYYDGVTPEIPIAYITLEDADLLTRISARGEQIRIYLNMQNIHRNSTSRNLFADIRGKEKPEEFVLFSGHTDTWDVGQGIQDDAIGVFLALEAFNLLKSLNLIPRRTLRLAFWTAEEYGFKGSAQYIKDHSYEFDNLSAVMEADFSCLASTGLVYYGVPELACILQEVINLVGSATTGLLAKAKKMSTDLDNFVPLNIPTISLLGDDGRYFWFHHTEADAITAGTVNSTEFDRCLALWTSTAFIIADVENKISRFNSEG
ncbi:unnamed protein product [Allacma fusca]|uniref:Carboxypeptidase Q n=1 Tax=Allacma fusca TaxID=39272 RepID=A0A8J2PV09_9HEXA|nr:unnamed protein product [Allacma fusca]